MISVARSWWKKCLIALGAIILLFFALVVGGRKYYELQREVYWAKKAVKNEWKWHKIPVMEGPPCVSSPGADILIGRTPIGGGSAFLRYYCKSTSKPSEIELVILDDKFFPRPGEYKEEVKLHWRKMRLGKMNFPIRKETVLTTHLFREEVTTKKMNGYDDDFYRSTGKLKGKYSGNLVSLLQEYDLVEVELPWNLGMAEINILFAEQAITTMIMQCSSIYDW